MEGTEALNIGRVAVPERVALESLWALSMRKRIKENLMFKLECFGRTVEVLGADTIV